MISVILSVFFCLLSTTGAQYSNDEDTFLCDLVQGSNIGSKLSSGWDCSSVGNKCNWDGVTCDSSGTILELRIDDEGISGTLPSSIGLLTELTYLNIQTNSFTGTIPSSIGCLTNLVEMFLRRNSFGGTVPDVFAQMAYMEKFRINDNAISGTIPPSFSNLSVVSMLSLNDNSFHGTIPSFFGTLTSLSSLELDKNDFTGSIPLSLSALTGLEKIEINKNSFSGTVPDIFAGMSSMTKLEFSTNSFSGLLPASIGSMSKLKRIIGDDNFLTGLPSTISQLTSLSNVKLKDCPLSDIGGLMSLSSLKSLRLRNANLSTTIPTSISNMNMLSILSMPACGLTGSLPSEVAVLTRLEDLDLESNSFTGAIPTGLWSLTLLTSINLGFNEFVGSIPSCISSLRNLNELFFSMNSFDNTLPSSIGEITSLLEFKIDQNSLTGTLPTSIGDLTALKELYLSENSFNGPIPSSIGDLGALELLYMNLNSLTGGVPSSFSHLTNIKTIKMYSNSLNGAYPSAICGVASLETFLLTDPGTDICRAPTALPSGEPTVSPTSEPSSLPSGEPTVRPSSAPSNDPTSQPTAYPSGEPTSQPTGDPTREPTGQPSSQPTGQPSNQPTGQPTTRPSEEPTVSPTSEPSSLPSGEPTVRPSSAPSSDPTSQPTAYPSGEPTSQPTGDPTREPTGQPSSQPTGQPSNQPTGQPTTRPSGEPTVSPTSEPSSLPSGEPTVRPSSAPSSDPTSQPTAYPSGEPTSQPTGDPTREPTGQPSSQPTGQPSNQPTGQPTTRPSGEPTVSPTSEPSSLPSGEPTVRPSSAPSSDPTSQPTAYPSGEPTSQPTGDPTREPTGQPSSQPTGQPSNQPTGQPTTRPSGEPTVSPTSEPSSLPSGEPTVRPSSAPSSDPTSQPTAYPSGEPTSQPTGDPTREPTGQPSSQPTGQPSNQPTGQPTTRPSGEPTVSPTSEPSSLPSGEPTVRPSSAPSSDPTSQPTAYPSGEPTSQPTGDPTREPTGQPSSQPTGQPSNQPTGQPTTRPSGEPTVSPTSEPSSLPSGEPTVRPSSAPSSDPTSQPTAYPSGEPTSQPTGDPTREPTGQPTTRPSRQPTGEPTLVPSLIPTSSPTIEPSAYPTSGPSFNPTSEPSCVPSGFPSALPSAKPSSLPTCVPTYFPSIKPTRRPTAQPTFSGDTNRPTSFPTIKPTIIPSSYPSLGPTSSAPTSLPTLSPTHSPPPDILNVEIDTTKYDVTIYANLSKEGMLYCGVYSISVSPLSTSSIIVKNNFASAPSPEVSAHLKVGNLQPSTSYDVYCVARSIYGMTTTFDDMMLNKERVRTACCKGVLISLTGVSFSERHDVPSFLTVTATAAPVSPLSVTLSAMRMDNSSVSNDMFIPKSIVINSKSWSISRPVALIGSSPGRYGVSAVISGPDASDYEVSFDGHYEFVLQPSNVEPPIPLLTSAMFTPDGLSIIVKFDSPTDMAGLSSLFPCSHVFSFVGDDYAICQWTSASAALVSLRGVPRVGVGDRIVVVDDVLRASCRMSYAECQQWATVNSTLAISIRGPNAPTSPVVVVSGPEVAGPCDKVVLDLLSSTGDGGRDWKNQTVAVQGQHSGSVESLNDFFLNAYDLKSLTPLPQDTLKPGYFYDFHFTLCNFLGACAQAVHHLVVTNSAVPSVQILGRNSRSITTDTSLVLHAQAYMSECDGVKSNSGLDYVWVVTRDGVQDSSVGSISRDVAKFKVLPFTMHPGSVYEFSVTVSNPTSLQKSSASAHVEVSQSDIVAVIAGGTHQTVRLGGSIILDATGSYDAGTPDSSDSRLTYSWSCYQRKPTLSSYCGIDMSINRSIVVAHPMPTTSALSEFVITVAVYDSSRESEQNVYISVGEALDPVGAISMMHPAKKFNAADDITLLGALELSLPAQIEWVVEGQSLDLATVSRTAVSRRFEPGQHVLNLVIVKNSLIGRINPYVFSLSANNYTLASMSVVVNSSPSPGVFSVSPPNGTAINTKFMFVASQWTDDDTPMSFQFGYLSQQGDVKVVRGRSESGYDTSVLPAGLKTDNYHLTCHVMVFDTLHAHTSSTAVVSVSETKLNSTDLQVIIAEELSVSTGNMDDTKETLSVASSLLNAIDCSSAPDCAVLDREECANVDNTCGRCLSGYIGTDGDDNSECISAETVIIESRINDTRSCDTDSDCGVWMYCDIESGICKKSSKECRKSCFGNGDCRYESVDTGIPVDVCHMGDTSCEAICKCWEGYSGDICKFRTTELEAKKLIRQQLLESLQSVCDTDEPSADSITTWQSSLNGITQLSDELSPDAADIALNIADSILSSVLEYDVSSDVLLGVLKSVDSAVVASMSSPKESVRRRLSTLVDTIDLLDTFGNRVAAGMVEGQRAIASINKMFRITTGVVSNAEYISIPQTSTELSSGIEPTTLYTSGQPDSTVRVSAMSIKARLYNNSADFNSNALRLQFINSMLDSNATVTFAIQNNVETTYESLYSSTVVNTTCLLGETGVYEHTCPGGHAGDILVTHTCNGSAVLIETKCPTVTALPACRVLSGESFNCYVRSYSITSTTCSCSRINDGGERRSLSIQHTGALEVVAVSELVTEDFVTTVSTSSELDSVEDLEKAVIVILLYGVMWTGGLLGIMMCSFRQWHLYRKVGENLSYSEKREKLASFAKSKADVRNYLTAYVNEVFPAVFLTKSVMRRLFDEICKHHRYLTLLTASGINGDSKRILTGLHLLTVQSMLMFVLAVCYDLQFPQDDGSCESHTTELSCLRQKSVFDVDKSVCSWDEDSSQQSGYSCTYESPAFTVWVIVIISVVVAVVTAPVNLLVDFLFIEILSAPGADAVKIQSRESVMVRAAQRASAVGRRVSAISAEAMNKLRKNVLMKSKSSLDFNSIQKTRVVPESMEEAHLLASVSIGDILHNVQEKLNSRVHTLDKFRKESNTFKSKQILVQKRRSAQRRVSDVSESQFDSTDAAIDDLFLDFTVDLAEQRKHVKRNQRESFDSMWGIDPTGEFSKQTERSIFCTHKIRSAERSLQDEMKFVRRETQAKFEKLRFATDVQIGMEILHLFIIDLLGRDTPVAKIFMTKSEEEHSFVVTKTVKVFAWILVACLNLFFVYFSVLRGLERGVEWQRLYLVACLMQFFIEIFFYETSECAIVHFYIPDLARNEVRSVGFAIHQAVNKVCTATVESAGNMILDAPRYFFVSSNVAKRFPDLLESAIVMSYHTYSPGELARKWRFSYSSDTFSTSLNPWSRSRSRVGRFTVSTVLVGILQRLGAMSPTVQRVVIHTLQPLVVSAIFLSTVVLRKHPLFICILVPLVLYIIYVVRRDLESESDNNSNCSAVHPSDFASQSGEVPDICEVGAPTRSIGSVAPIGSDDKYTKPPINSMHSIDTPINNVTLCDKATEECINLDMSDSSEWSISSGGFDHQLNVVDMFTMSSSSDSHSAASDTDTFNSEEARNGMVAESMRVNGIFNAALTDDNDNLPHEIAADVAREMINASTIMEHDSSLLDIGVKSTPAVVKKIDSE